ncbi:MAG: hypothetical protein KGJ02_02740 [Verrucomicrobiota bacterium]|nr:hypothetical protein [Verrucomicrobiota bacterium]
MSTSQVIPLSAPVTPVADPQPAGNLQGRQVRDIQAEVTALKKNELAPLERSLKKRDIMLVVAAIVCVAIMGLSLGIGLGCFHGTALGLGIAIGGFCGPMSLLMMSPVFIQRKILNPHVKQILENQDFLQFVTHHELRLTLPSLLKTHLLFSKRKSLTSLQDQLKNDLEQAKNQANTKELKIPTIGQQLKGEDLLRDLPFFQFIRDNTLFPPSSLQQGQNAFRGPIQSSLVTADRYKRAKDLWLQKQNLDLQERELLQEIKQLKESPVETDLKKSGVIRILEPQGW